VQLFIFARFHAQPGKERDVERAVREVLLPSRAEPGCVRIQAFRSVKDRQLFYIHSQWKDEAAFETHAGLAHTVRFLGAMERLVDQPLEISRTRPLP
jgi:quinol monooxygenase YgiN